MASGRTFTGALGAVLLVALVWSAPAQAGQECGDTGDIEGRTDSGASSFVEEECGITCRLGCRTYATACIGLTAGALACDNRTILREAGDDRALCFNSSDPKERSDCILEATLGALDDLNSGSTFANAIALCTGWLRSREDQDCTDCESCSD